jgi:hypothetical protein
LPEQQLSVALHWFVCRRQMSPFGLQPEGFAQTPTPESPVKLQTPGGEGGWLLSGRPPQQSDAFVQMSPTGLHPLAGWQMNTCVGPHGAQSRLQQSPPQAGNPPSVSPASVALHTTPSIALHCAPVCAGCPQVPNVWPDWIVQMPPQQSVPFAQMSPC